MHARQRWRNRLVHVIRTDPASRPVTEAMLSVDEVYARRVIDLAMRIAEALTATGASANEVVLAAIRVSAALGIKPVHVDITYNSIAVSYHRDETELPFTLVRVVRAPIPDYAKLQQLQALVADIEAGDIALDPARARFHAIRRTPFPYRPVVIVSSQGLLGVGVGVLYGAPWLVLGIILLASVAAALTQRLLARARVPFFFAQAAGAAVVVGVAAATNWLRMLGAPGLEDVRPTVIVASGIVLMLAGLSVVAAAQDAIDGFALTAGGRILDLALFTLGVVVGVVLGIGVADALGVSIPRVDEPPALGPLWMQIVGAVIISFTVAIWNGALARTTAVSVALGTIAWLGYSFATFAGLSVPVASGLGACLASFLGALVAHRWHVPSIAVVTAAIVPMVPGSAVFRGILAVAQANDDAAQLITGVSGLVGAAAIGIALASGATLGLVMGAPLRDTMQSAMRRRNRRTR